MSVRLYVGNLPKDLERQDLEAVFSEYGDAASTKLITDRKTGKCRGFAFVTVQDDEQANQIIEKFNGHDLQGSELKIEVAQPRAKGKEESAAGAPNTSKRNKSASNKGRKGGSATTSTTEASQPDPRWAQELERLKELLAAQTTNS
ncbi:MAG: RNA recognition motif domain-containing protein [Elainellaceae cyanobacterium]